MLVVALPKRLLVPLHNSTGDSSLRLLTSKTLRAMRPSDFSEMIAPRLWIDRRLLLPRRTIRRAYLVRKESREWTLFDADTMTRTFG